MSGEGGEEEHKNSSEIEDFENNSSAVEEDIRARVESAENNSIDQAAENGFSESKTHKKDYRATSTARIVILTIFGTLLGACFIFAVVFAAVRLGSSDLFKNTPEQTNKVNEDVFMLTFGEKSLLYTLGDKNPKTNGTYLFSDYGLEDSTEYLVITRMSQLTNLQESYNKYSNEAIDFAELLGLNDAFFDSGSVIAIATESRYIGSLQTTKISRDEYFGLNIMMSQTNLTDVDFVTTPQLAGYLNLIKVDNVQPKQLTVYIDNNQKEENAKQEE